MQIDRTLGSTARLYSSLAPALAPAMKELFGEGKTSMAHKAVSDGISHYQNVRGEVQRARWVAESIIRNVQKQ